MWRVVASTLMVQCIFLTGFAQIKKNYSVQDRAETETVHFTLSSSTGTCNIKPTKHSSLVNIYELSNRPNGQFNQHLDGNTQYVSLNTTEDVSADISKKISFRFFSNRSDQNDICNVYLSQNKPLILNLNYGMGDANVDLSGMLVKQLMINTGSADVNVSCMSGKFNKIEMDTFFVKVDMGELNVRNVNLTRSKAIIADVGFGNLNLDFSDSSLVKSEVTANVGAGKLQIILPLKETPVIVYINDSPLCRVKLTKHFKSLDRYTFVNDSYDEDAPNLITFNVGVAMGHIVFKDQ